ncbi:type VI secretion system tip protein VgrG [Parashewanella curva]|uniref:Type VI secretion system tip protein VgrG n=1 Tax=Parashewanella curva TaxID=2338552 RepID=A0A3L8Q0X6_9GAMM|nr:type VI secretion system tip protein TssI/VgrG [Parashewanella curva]RLV61235.1 type VI secretion system tip protein VgrG [Parashewanella curva]
MAVTDFDVSVRPMTAKLNGKGPYIATKLHCSEAISEGTQIDLSIISDTEISAQVLGKDLSVKVKYKDETRQFTGLISAIVIEEYSLEKNIYYYRISAVDPISLLKYRSNQQMFQSMETKRIIEQILEDSETKTFTKLSLVGSGRDHEYCTQMGETDLAFIKRLMSMEGWYYYLDHTASKPTVVISDSNNNFVSIDNSSVSYKDLFESPERVITQWQFQTSLGTASLSLSDHTQQLAEVFSSDERQSNLDYNFSGLQAYYYGQGCDDKGVIRDFAKLQMEALDTERTQANSCSNIIALFAGTTFKLSNHPVSEVNQEYVVTQINHVIDHAESGSQIQYQNNFQCIPISVPFRPKLQSRPKTQGLHTATVTGPSGDEIYTDKKGQIKVQFHWDAIGQNDENTSCWLPVSQICASNGFGAVFMPRIGDEVLVQYIDGNPDRPVVVGSIYNTNNQIPYDVITQSGIKTRTSPNGSSDRANELVFEDKEDNEQIYLHGEKDLLIDVKNDIITTIANDSNTSIENDCISTIKGNQTTTVEKAIEMTCKEAWAASTDKDFTVSTKGTFSATADKDITMQANSGLEAKAISSVTVDGQSVEISGKTKIALSVGGCSIELSPSGIKISAPQVEISGQAKAELKAAMVTVEGQGKADLKGALVSVEGTAMTQLKAGAMVQLQGAIAKIN